MYYVTVAGPFYPFGAGDTENDRSDDGSSPVIYLLQPFIFFGQTYNQLYVSESDHINQKSIHAELYFFF